MKNLIKIWFSNLLGFSLYVAPNKKLRFTKKLYLELCSEFDKHVITKKVKTCICCDGIINKNTVIIDEKIISEDYCFNCHKKAEPENVIITKIISCKDKNIKLRDTKISIGYAIYLIEYLKNKLC